MLETENESTRVDTLVAHATEHVDRLYLALNGYICARVTSMAPAELHSQIESSVKSRDQILEVLKEFERQDKIDNTPHNVVNTLIDTLAMLANMPRTPEQNEAILKILGVYQNLTEPKPFPGDESQIDLLMNSVIQGLDKLNQLALLGYSTDKYPQIHKLWKAYSTFIEPFANTLAATQSPFESSTVVMDHSELFPAFAPPTDKKDAK